MTFGSIGAGRRIGYDIFGIAGSKGGGEGEVVVARCDTCGSVDLGGDALSPARRRRRTSSRQRRTRRASRAAMAEVRPAAVAMGRACETGLEDGMEDCVVRGSVI